MSLNIKFRLSRRRWPRLRYFYCGGMYDHDPHLLAVLTRTLAKFVSVSRTIEENLLSHSILQRSEENCKEICELAMQSKHAHLLISRWVSSYTTYLSKRYYPLSATSQAHRLEESVNSVSLEMTL